MSTIRPDQQRLIDWCRIERGFERAAVACEAVRGIVKVGDSSWDILVAEFGQPSDADWTLAQRTYGPTFARCEACGAAYPLGSVCNGCGPSH